MRVERPANDNRRPLTFAEAERSWRIVGVLLIVLVALMWALTIRAAFADAVITGTARVIDGDTIDVGVVRIRLHGIDAPEAGQRCGEANGRGSWACGTAATNRMAELVDGQQIACEARDRDQYGRIIAVCFADDEDVNAVLISEGAGLGLPSIQRQLCRSRSGRPRCRNRHLAGRS